ncbi:hypothetical protein GIB67_024517 [Kingdonia uniflora]|uniref:Uncharacterized protein n=1 Tax=Kingdonia uniflora TaxID=39325 RepID=A0A7J7LP27_9MAGN|nr:hypothetical protein GIB67_024517 [Kingdonia uniflora]
MVWRFYSYSIVAKKKFHIRVGFSCCQETMELHPSLTANVSMSRCCVHMKGECFRKLLPIYVDHRDRARCLASKGSSGFGSKPPKETNRARSAKEELKTKTRKPTSSPADLNPNRAPGLSGRQDGKSSNVVSDLQFEERLEAIRRSALKQKKTEESKPSETIDYDLPVESEKNTVGIGTKVRHLDREKKFNVFRDVKPQTSHYLLSPIVLEVGVGVAVVVFGLVFALGDFLPSESASPTDETTMIGNKLTTEEKSTLQARLQEYEVKLSTSQQDADALEGAAVTLAELGEYDRAASLLEKLSKENSSDPEVYRLLGEVKYELKDYDGSAAAYRSSLSVSKTFSFEALRGLTNTLLDAKRPDEAVKVLLDSRELVNRMRSDSRDGEAGGNGNTEKDVQKVDPTQVDLLLGKAYSDWGHVSDAVSVYDRLISTQPNDFRGYLAKGIILKENGKAGEAERMFIQARFFAPEKAKPLVDRYSRQ